MLDEKHLNEGLTKAFEDLSFTMILSVYDHV